MLLSHLIKRMNCLHDLYSNGYIHFGKKVNNLNIKIDLGDTDDDIAYKVTKFENIGNQYIGNFKRVISSANPGCGRKIKITNNRKMYCSKCYKEINEANAKEQNEKI